MKIFLLADSFCNGVDNYLVPKEMDVKYKDKLKLFFLGLALVFMLHLLPYLP